jgi:CDP-diacylglycerol--serine O-phosphatidyltransferase
MKKPKLFAVLPTLLTLGNAACGFGAITFAAKVGPEPGTGSELFIAAILIYLAMIFDMLDGSAARWAKQTSDFGAQLDSLCDAISFGVAPAFLMIQFTRHANTFDGLLEASFSLNFQERLLSRLLWIIGALYVICALLRLARFNVETEDEDTHETFSGLPSPAAAGTIASFPIAMHGVQNFVAPDATARAHAIAEWLEPSLRVALPLITLSVACLMVSRILYPHVFNQLFRGQRNRRHLIQLVFTFPAIYLADWMAVPLIFCYFSFASPLRALWKEVIAGRLKNSWR